ncbi:MAG: hypothetical protein ACP5E5_09635 [Acidobacteriaceae bacterium]
MQTRTEITEAIVAAYRAELEMEAGGSSVSADAKAYEQIIRSAVAAKLKSLAEDKQVRTCADFGYLGIACCNACHTGYPHYELDLVELELGGSAWICCALNRALNPARHQERLNSPDYDDIDAFLGGGPMPQPEKK